MPSRGALLKRLAPQCIQDTGGLFVAVAGDDERYQTVYARQKGSVAAPTAGLHFTQALFDQLEARGYVGAFDGANARVVLRRDDGPGPSDEDDA